MTIGGELGSAFVRIRPSFGGFRSEATAGVKVALKEMQAEVNAAARSNVTAAVEQVKANQALAASYQRIGAAAARGSEEARVAARLAARATEEANAAIGLSARRAGEEVRGLRSRLLNVGTLFGVGFGAFEAVKFTKEVSSAAANVQKSIEVIKATFGKDAAEVIVRFGDTVASKLGISAQLADATSARFGILFHNLGIAQPTSAMMTVQLEKLAGALGAIKGVDPSSALNSLDRAMLGNIRGLKTLGLSVDPALEKLAALKLHLISSVKEGLTPAVRAQAIFALATAHLGDYLDLAKKHAGDLANRQRMLSAEWSNAKDALGTVLLPIFSKYVGKLADWLQMMLKTGRLQRAASADIHAVGKAFHAVHDVLAPLLGALHRLVGIVGGVSNAVKIMLATFVISKIAGFASAITNLLIRQSILAIGPAAIAAQAETTVAFAGIGISAEAMSATIKGALISTGIGALAVLAGVAAFEIIQHWGTVKRWFGEFTAYIRPELNKVREAIHAFVAFTSRLWRDWGATIIAFARNAWKLVKGTIQNELNLIRGVLDVFKGLFTGDWHKLWKGLKEIVKAGLDQAKLVVSSWGKAVLILFGGIWRNVEEMTLRAVAAVTGLLAKIPTSFKVFGHKVGFDNPFKAITADLKGQIAGIEAVKNAKEIAAATARNTAAALAARTRDPSIAEAGLNLGKHVAKHVKMGVADGLTGDGKKGANVGDAVAESVFNQSVKDAISGAKKRLAEAISSGNESIASAQQALGNFIVAGQKRIAAVIKAGNETVSKAAVAAGVNLNTIGKKLTDTIGKYLSTGAQAADLAKGPLGQQFQRLKAALLSGHGGPELINAAQQLASQLQSSQAKSGAITKKKAGIAQHVADLADELNRGLISVKSFHSRVITYLQSQGISYAKVGKALGRAQGDAYLQELDALFKQAGIITAEPKSLRDAVRKHTAAAAAGVKIIDPNTIRAAADKKAADVRDSYKTGLDQRIAAVGRVERHAAERVAAARHAEALTVQREGLRVQEHAVQVHKRAVRAQEKAAKAAKKTADTNASIAATTVNTSGFPSATTKNPGVTATRARHGAQGGLTP